MATIFRNNPKITFCLAMSHSELLSACHFLCREPSEIWREFWRQTFSCESPAIFWRGERAHSWQRGQPVQDSVDSKSCSAVQILLSQYTVYLYKVLLFRLPKYKTRTSGPGQCGQQIVHSADTMDTVQCNVMHCNAQKISLSCTLKYRVWLPQYRSRTKHSAKPIYNAEYD